MTYLFQVVTRDPALQLRTEVNAATISELQRLAKNVVKNNPVLVDMKYIIAQYKRVNNKFKSATLKTGVITGQ